jgi:hypothetical protein
MIRRYNEIQIKGARKYDTEPGDICPYCGELMSYHSTMINGYRRECKQCNYEC